MVRIPQQQLVKRRDPVVIGGDASFAPEHFLVPLNYGGAIKEIMIPHGLVVD